MVTILLRFILGVTPVSAEETLKVILGQDRVFETCNWHDQKTEVAPYHPGKLAPTTLYSNSSGQIAISQVIAGPNQEGTASAWVGVIFSVEANDAGEQAREAEISITAQYDATANLNVGTGGSTQARVLTEIAGNFDDLTMINFGNSNHDATSGTKTITHKILLEAGKGYVVYAHSFVEADIYDIGTATSQCSVSIQDVKVKFIKKIYGLFIGVTETKVPLLPTTFKGAEAAQRLETEFKGIEDVVYTLFIPINLDSTGGVDKELIHSAINGFNKMMRSGDIFFLFFFGHGGQVKTENTHSEFLLCGPESDSFVWDFELPFWLKEMNPAISKWIVVEACHSGGFLEDFNNYGLNNFSFLASAQTDKTCFYDFSGFGLFGQALFDAFKRDKNGRMAVGPEGDGFTFNDLYLYILSWKINHRWYYTNTIVYEMDQGDPILYTDDLFIPVAFQSFDFIDGMPTGQKRNPATAALYLLLLD